METKHTVNNFVTQVLLIYRPMDGHSVWWNLIKDSFGLMLHRTDRWTEGLLFDWFLKKEKAYTGQAKNGYVTNKPANRRTVRQMFRQAVGQMTRHIAPFFYEDFYTGQSIQTILLPSQKVWKHLSWLTLNNFYLSSSNNLEHF